MTSILFVINFSTKFQIIGIHVHVHLYNAYIRSTKIAVTAQEVNTAQLHLGCARFVKKNFSLISQIKRIWIRFTCIHYFTIKFHFSFFASFCLFLLQIFCFASI
jgi:hypothetical protein